MERRILVIRFGSLGDVILTSAAVLNLKISFPDSRLTFLTKARFGDVVRGMDGVDDIALLPDNASANDLIRLLLSLDHAKFDTVVDLHGNFRSWLSRKLISGATAVVYPKRRAERIALARTHRIPDSWPHTIDLYNHTVSELGGRIAARRPVLHPPSNAVDPEVLRLFEQGRPVVAIAPGAAHSNKQWPIERFAETAALLHEESDAAVIWAVTDADADKLDITAYVPAEQVAIARHLPIPDLAAVIGRCDATIANDSGIAHLSSAVGTPVTAVFGPTHPALGFAPAGLFDRVVDVEEYCRPCSLHGGKPCFRDERHCLTRIQPDRVATAVAGTFTAVTRANRALFVDRDGTLILDKHYLSDPEQIEFETGAVEGLRLARDYGFKIVILSNQSGVARGYFGTETVELMNRRLLEMLERAGLTVDGVYYCPHHPKGTAAGFGTVCTCRKPAPAMAEQAAMDLHLDLRRSWVVGDKLDDVQLARVIGGRGILVRTGYGADQETLVEKARLREGHGIEDDLLAAVKRLIAED